MKSVIANDKISSVINERTEDYGTRQPLLTQKDVRFVKWRREGLLLFAQLKNLSYTKKTKIISEGN